VDIVPINDSFGAEIAGVDLCDLDGDAFAEIAAALWQFAVLVFPGQDLDQEDQAAFAARFGPLEDAPSSIYRNEARQRMRGDITDVSNIDDDGNLWRADSRVRQLQLANQLWHTDSSFKHVPALASCLFARVVPPVGGHTEFADLRAAYDALAPERRARLDGLIARHTLMASRRRMGFDGFSVAEAEAMKAVPQRLVRVLPETGRRTLYLASHIESIDGLARADGDSLVEELIAHATARRFVYRHRWRVGDLVLWDNRCTMHRATSYDDLRWGRELHRATVADKGNSAGL
jgi:alpha-ketoglutarate-dependent 2,4-dichlorophenoxyacetate dioxygenase